MSLDFLKRVRNYKFKQCRSEDCNVFFYDANEVLFIFCSFKIYYFSEPILNNNIQLYFHSFLSFSSLYYTKYELCTKMRLLKEILLSELFVQLQ